MPLFKKSGGRRSGFLAGLTGLFGGSAGTRTKPKVNTFPKSGGTLDELQKRQEERRNPKAKIPAPMDVPEANVYGPETEMGKFLAGEIIRVQSSNVAWIAYFEETQEIHVGFLNGSVYGYYGIPLHWAVEFFDSGSKGGFLWDNFRVRGTVFGHRVPYALLDGPSSYHPKWHAQEKWRIEHGGIPKPGDIPKEWLDKPEESPYPNWFS